MLNLQKNALLRQLEENNTSIEKEMTSYKIKKILLKNAIVNLKNAISCCISINATHKYIKSIHQKIKEIEISKWELKNEKKSMLEILNRCNTRIADTLDDIHQEIAFIEDNINNNI